MKPGYICGLALWGTVGIFIAASVLAPKLGSEPLGPPLDTNWIDPLKLTNSFVWEAPQPSKVTIWFEVMWGNFVMPDSITTNVWPVTASNALEMVKSRYPRNTNSIIETVILTGIWRDE